MKKITVLLFLISFMLFAGMEEMPQKYRESFISRKNNWKDCLNNGGDSIKDFYFKESLLFKDGIFYEGKENIEISLKEKLSFKGKISNVELRNLKKYDTFKFLETGTITTETNAMYDYMIVWEFYKKNWNKTIELIFEHEKTEGIENEIEKARRKWELKAGTHDTVEIVKEMYMENGGYFGQEQLRVGHKELIEAFNSPFSDVNNNFKLEADYINVVSNKTVYEIGRYSTGQFNGNYIFVWQKDENGNWKVGLDYDF